MTSGNDYVPQVKGNQPKLRAALATCHAANPAPAGATHCHSERRDGKVCTWQTSVYAADPTWQATWDGLQRVVVVVKTVAGPQATTQQTRYYLTSLATGAAAELAAELAGTGASKTSSTAPATCILARIPTAFVTGWRP